MPDTDYNEQLARAEKEIKQLGNLSDEQFQVEVDRISKKYGIVIFWNNEDVQNHV